MNKYTLACAFYALAVRGIYAQCNCSGSSSSVSFTETGNASLTLNKNQWLTEMYGDYRSFGNSNSNSNNNNILHDHSSHSHGNTDAIADSSASELNSSGIALGGIRYGLTNKITLSLQLPYVWLNAKPTGARGIGDLMLIATVKALEKNGCTFALLGGFELPTGTRSSLTAESNTAIGSGSFDPILGAMAVKSFDKSFIRANAFYKYSTKGYDQVNFGSFFSHNVTFGYKLITKESCSADSINAKTKLFSWSIFASGLGEWNSRQVRENIFIENTGGYSLFFQAGTLFSFGKWSIPLAFTLPVMQELKGEQSQTKFRTRIGIIKTF